MSSEGIGLTLLLGSGLSCGLVWLWGGLCLVGGLLVVKSSAGRGLCCCKIQGLAWELAQVLTESEKPEQNPISFIDFCIRNMLGLLPPGVVTNEISISKEVNGLKVGLDNHNVERVGSKKVVESDEESRHA
ncbi:hypothetical protein U1Q18_017701 [Sarracenia purpurea var. burkii]